jgi:hypothetical protein
MIHELKSWVGLFEPIMKGEKTHDFRVLDRDFQVGDSLRLREYEPTTKKYTGREVTVDVTYITSAKHQQCAFSPYALHPGMGVLSIKLSTPQLPDWDGPRNCWGKIPLCHNPTIVVQSMPVIQCEDGGLAYTIPGCQKVPGHINLHLLPPAKPEDGTSITDDFIAVDCSNATCGADSLTARMGPSFEEHEAA